MNVLDQPEFSPSPSEPALCRTEFSSTTAIVTRSEAERTTRMAAMAALWAFMPIRSAHQLQSREERKYPRQAPKLKKMTLKI